MGSLRRKTATKPLPDGAELFERKGQQFARWLDSKGRKKSAATTTGKDGSLRIVVEAGKWLAKFRDGNGIKQEVSTGCKDKGAAASVLAELEKRAELVRSNVITSAQDAIGDHSGTPIGRHVDSYLTHLRSKSDSKKHQRNVATCLTRLSKECHFQRLRDISADRLESWLLDAADAGMSARTRNRHRSALCAFCAWCVLSGRLSSNPVLRVATANEKADRRHQRRALTEDEIGRLLDAAERRPLLDAATVRRGPNVGKPLANVTEERRIKFERLGRERRLIYRVMLLTGLRKSELMSITIGQTQFDDINPRIELEAGDDKSRDGAFIPLRADLADELRDWIGERRDQVFESRNTLSFSEQSGFDPLSREPLLRVPDKIDRVFNADAELAGISKRDERDRVVDVHSLRTTFCSMLNRAGVAPRTAQAAMRHSDIRLTMETYNDPKLLDIAGAVESLPKFSTVRPNEARATGTDNMSTSGKCPPLFPPGAGNLRKLESFPVTLAIERTQSPRTGERREKRPKPTKKAPSEEISEGALSERVRRIEPPPTAWEAVVLPLNYTRSAGDYGGAGSSCKYQCDCLHSRAAWLVSRRSDGVRQSIVVTTRLPVQLRSDQPSRERP
jgi:integrase